MYDKLIFVLEYLKNNLNNLNITISHCEVIIR